MRLETLTNQHWVDEDTLLKTEFFQKIINEDQQVQNLRGPFTASKLLEVFLLQDAKKSKREPEKIETVKSEPTFFYTSSAYESMALLSGREAQKVNQRLEDFVNLKKSNPLAPFGKTDRLFSAMSALAGFKHAHLTHDVSVVYKYDGKKNQFCIFGVFGHADMGTDATNPNQRKQQAMGIRLHNQKC